MTNEIIEVKQLPVIVEQLHLIKAEIEAQAKAVLAMDCTEETVKDIKKQRTDLGNRFKEFEAKRKSIHDQIEAPYEAFMAVYKECIAAPFKEADSTLATRINEVTNTILQRKIDEVRTYANEYIESVGLTEGDIRYEEIPLKVTQVASLKSLKESVKNYVDKIKDDLTAISQLENSGEILVEYRMNHDLSRSLSIVTARKKAIEQELARREALESKAKEEAERKETVTQAVEEHEKESEDIKPPVVSEAPVEVPVTVDRYSVSFTVTATLDQLKALKEFLNNGGYEYANN